MEEEAAARVAVAAARVVAAEEEEGRAKAAAAREKAAREMAEATGDGDDLAMAVQLGLCPKAPAQKAAQSIPYVS